MAATNRYLWSLLGALLLAACARMGVPPGGPEDKTPPEVTFSSPERDSTFVDRRRDIVIEFSEQVNRASVEASLYLSPEPGKRLKYKWSGRRLTLNYLDPLPENRTIVATVGTQAKDLQGNAFEKSYTFAFSTGDHIDRGEIAGVVALPEKIRAFSVFAYLIRDSVPHPLHHTPDYRIQTDETGAFELGYLAPGYYRLFAIDDKNFDGLWSPPTEWIGTATSDVEVEEGRKPHVSFVPTLQDTTPPAILRARQYDERRVDIRLNHTGVPRVEIGNDAATLELAEHIIPDTTASNSWFVYFNDSLSVDSALLHVQIDDARMSARFQVKSRKDTTAPSLRDSWPGNRAKLRALPRNANVTFNEPIAFAQSDSFFVKLKADTTDVEVSVEQSDPVSLTITPAQPFEVNKKYSLHIPREIISDRGGNPARDSLMSIAWYVYPEDSLGEIDGIVRASVMGPWIVELYPLGAREPSDSVFTNTHFKFTGHPAGDYRIRVIRDANDNERFDSGSVIPFAFAEPFKWHPDTISVRPRWTADVEILWINVESK